jgi:excisionase family DNA binding protein
MNDNETKQGQVVSLPLRQQLNALAAELRESIDRVNAVADDVERVLDALVDVERMHLGVYLTPAQAARITGRSVRTMQRWAEQGRIPSVRQPNGTIAIPSSALESVPRLTPRDARQDAADGTSLSA